MISILKINTLNNSQYYLLDNEYDKISYVITLDNKKNIVSIKKKNYDNIIKKLYLGSIISIDNEEEINDIKTKIQKIANMI